MSSLDFNNPIISQLRSGKSDDQYVVYTNVPYKVVNQTILLAELPLKSAGVTVKDTSTTPTTTYVETTSGTPGTTEFYVDYVNGLVKTASVAEGKTLEVSFTGRGGLMVPSSRTYTAVDTSGNITEVLSDKLTALDTADTAEATTRAATDSSLQNQITQEVTDRAAADAAHANSTTAHDLKNLVYSGTKIVGATTGQGAVDKLSDRIDGIVSYSGSSNQEIVDARASVDGTAHATLKARLDPMEQRQLAASIASAALAHGWNYLLTNDASPLNVTVQGRTLVNILGKDGGCESLTSFTTLGTVATSTTQVKQGTNSFKTTDSASQSYVYKDFTYPLDTTKQYILGGWVYIESYTSGAAGMKLWDAGGFVNFRYAAPVDTTKVGQWQFIYVKIPTANTLAGSGFRLQIGSTVTSTQVAYFDAIRLYELDLTTYNAIGSTYTASTSPSIDDILPYVDSVKHLQGVAINKPGKNLLPDFTQWNVNASAVVNSPYSLTLTAASTFRNTTVTVSALPNQQYTLSCSGMVSGQKFEVHFLDSSGTDLGGYANLFGPSTSVTFTTPSNCQSMLVYSTNSATGTFTFTNPQLELGSTASTFQQRNDDFIYGVLDAAGNSLKLAGNPVTGVYDSLYYRDGAWRRESRWARDVAMDGSLAWVYNTDYIGYKGFYAPMPGPSAYAQNTGSIVKYNGNIIPLISTLTGGDQGLTGSGSGHTNVSLWVNDADTGFDNAYAPANNEFQAFMYGWKVNGYTAGTTVTNEVSGAVAAAGTYTLAHAGKYKSVTVQKSTDNVTFTAAVEGTDYTANWNATNAVITNPTAGTLYYQITYTYGVSANSWASVVDGSAPSTNTLAYVSVTKATGYTPYSLTYQLATTTEEVVTVEGSIDTNSGGNQIEVAEGYAVREVVTPYYYSAGSTYYLNNNNFSTSNFTKRAEKIVKIYKNGIDNTSAWTIGNIGSPYGKQSASIPASSYDATTVYTVTYQIMSNDRGGYTVNTVSVTGSYNSTQKDILDNLNKHMADAETSISVLQETTARKNQSPWIAPTMQNAWVNYGGTDAVAGYMKDDFGWVNVKGRIKNGVIGQTAFALPTGYKVKETQRFVVSSNGAFGELVVNPDGTFVPTVGSNVSFNVQVRYRAEQ